MEGPFYNRHTGSVVIVGAKKEGKTYNQAGSHHDTDILVFEKLLIELAKARKAK